MRTTHLILFIQIVDFLGLIYYINFLLRLNLGLVHYQCRYVTYGSF